MLKFRDLGCADSTCLRNTAVSYLVSCLCWLPRNPCILRAQTSRLQSSSCGSVLSMSVLPLTMASCLPGAISLHVRDSPQISARFWSLLLLWHPALLYGRGNAGGPSTEMNQPARVVCFRRSTPMEVHLLLLSFLVLPSAFHVGCGLGHKMEFWEQGIGHKVPVGLSEICIPQHISFSLSIALNVIFTLS